MNKNVDKRVLQSELLLQIDNLIDQFIHKGLKKEHILETIKVFIRINL